MRRRGENLNKDIIIPKIKFYNQDIVDLYDKVWALISKNYIYNKTNKNIPKEYLSNPGQKTFNYFYSVLPAFFLLYSSEKYDPEPVLDFFYSKQEPNGAIRCDYDVQTGEPVQLNPEDKIGLTIPLFPWAEYNYFVKNGNKKRLKEVAPKIISFYKWLKSEYMDETGLFRTEQMNFVTGNIDRSNTAYPVDFNSAMAFYCLNTAMICEKLKDKDAKLSFRKQYFALKSRINKLMWHNDFYYDLDANGNPIPMEMLSSYFALLARIPDEEKTNILISHLKDPKMFGTDNPFPSVPVRCKRFSKDGNGFYGGVSSALTFIAIKAAEAAGEFSFAKECTLKHAFCMIESQLLSDKKIPDGLWEVYKPNSEGPSLYFANPKRTAYELPRQDFLPVIGVAVITLFIENVIGFSVDMFLKTVTWTLESYDQVGIENYYLKKNYISMECTRENERWEIRLNSDKLYYLKVRILGERIEKELSIPAGRCSLLPEKF